MSPDATLPVPIVRTKRTRTAHEYGLVLAAVGIDSEVYEEAGESVVAVPHEHAQRAASELAQYDDENRGWRRPDELPQVIGESWLGVVVWILLLVVTQSLGRARAFGVDWWSHGANAADAVQHGQVWRTVTALGLHVDPMHLLGNLAFGALFVALVCELLGTGFGLFAVITTGGLANLANAWINDGDFRSVGASTAVFAALGILGGHRWQQRKRVRDMRRASWIPLLASAFLLAYLGSGSGGDMKVERVDVLGHACGFVVGALFGALLGRYAARLRLGHGAQVAFGALALALWSGAWILALQRWN